jgi:spermidine synthase
MNSLMPDATAHSTSNAFRRTVLVIYTLSGFCGLLYELVWTRYLKFVFGSTSLAVSTVVAAFMAGLALGSWILGRRADRVRFPLRFYGWVEVGIGLYALLFLPLYFGLKWVYLDIPFMGQGTFFARSLWRFVLSLALLLLPTVLMGGTFPILGKFFVRSKEEAGVWSGRMYALNTVGGMLGVFAGGLVLPTFLGLKMSLWLAGLVNILLGLSAVLLSKKFEEARDPEAVPLQPGEKPGLPRDVWVLAAALLLSGLAALSYEILWVRLLGLALGSSIYAFTLILGIYLAGLALGSWAWARWAGHRNVGSGSFALLQAGIAFFALLTFPLVNGMPYWVARLLPSLRSSFVAVQGFYSALIAALLLAATVLMGATIPAGIQLAVRSARDVARRIGTLYAFNTVGAILGSFLAGFILIPFLGVKAGFLLTAGLNLFTGLFLLLGSRRPNTKTILAAGLIVVFFAGFMVLLPPLNTHRLAVGSYLYFNAHQPYLYNSELYDFYTKDFFPMPFYRDGLTCAVSVLQSFDGEVTTLKLNGKTDASSDPGDMITQVLTGVVPLTLHPEAKRVLVIGMGSGVTLGSVLEFPVEKAVQVELEAEVVEASKYFTALNGDCLKDPRAELVVEDGRNYLLACREPFDIIISEPSNPWMPGVANLFSIESFELLKEKTRTPGVVCQWLQVYNMDPRDVKMILKGFQTVFPDMALFHTSGGNLLMIGFNGSVASNPARVEALIEGHPGIQRRLKGIKLPDVYALWEWSWIGDGKSLQSFWNAPGPLNTDDKPVLEVRAAARIYRDMARNIYDDLRSRATKLPMERWLPDPKRRAEVYAAAAQAAYLYGDPGRGIHYLNRALSLDPENPDYAAAAEAIRKNPAVFPEEPSPEDITAHSLFAQAEQFRQAGQTRTETDILKSLERRKAYNPAVYIRLAELDIQSGDPHSARRRLLLSICMNPYLSEPHMLLGTVYARLGKIHLAALEQERYLELSRR